MTAPDQTPSRPTAPASALLEAVRANRAEIDFTGRRLEDEVILDAVSYPHRLVLRNVVFAGRVSAREARFGRSVELTGCTFEQGLDLTHAQIHGSLRLGSATLHAGPEGTPASSLFGLRVGEDLLLSGLEAAGDLNLRGAHVGGFLIAESAGRPFRVGGNLDLAYADVTHNVHVPSAAVAGTVVLSMARVGGTLVLTGSALARGLHGKGLQLGGDFLGGGIRSGGLFDLREAKIEGTVDLAAEPNPGIRTILGRELVLDRAQVGGDVSLDGIEVQQVCSIREATVGGTLSARPVGDWPATFPVGLSLEQARIRGNVALCGAQFGQLHCPRAELGGWLNLSCEGPHRTTVGDALTLSGLSVAGTVQLDGMLVRKDAMLDNVEVKGEWLARASGPHRPAFEGRLHLGGARIGKMLGLSGAVITGNLDLSNATVDHDVVLADHDGQACEVGGDVFLVSARIGGMLSLNRAVLGRSLQLARAEVEGYSLLAGVEVRGSLDLAHAAVGALSWTAASGQPTVLHGPAQFLGLRVAGSVSWRGVECRAPVWFRSATVGGGVEVGPDGPSRPVFRDSFDMAGTRVATGVVFSGIEAAGLVLANVDIGGMLSFVPADQMQTTVHGQTGLSGAQIRGGVFLSGARFEGHIHFTDASLGGDLVAGPWEGTRPVLAGGLGLIRAKVHGGVRLSGSDIGGDVDLEQAEVGGTVFATSTEPRPTAITGNLRLAGACVDGDVMLDGLTLGGDVQATSVTIGGTLFLRHNGWARPSVGNVWADKAEMAGVVMYGAEVRGVLSLHQAEVNGLVALETGGGQRTTVAGPFHLQNARVLGGVSLLGAEVHDCNFVAVETAGLYCKAAGELRAVCHGTLDATAARIGADARFGGADLHGGVSLQYATVSGAVSFAPEAGQRTVVAGRAALGAMNVRGNVTLDGAHFRETVVLLYTQVGGAVYAQPVGDHSMTFDKGLMLPRAHVRGAVRLRGASLGGPLDLSFAEIEGTLQASFLAGQLFRVAGDVNLTGARVTGEVNLTRADIGGQLNLDSSRLGVFHLGGLQLKKGLRACQAELQDVACRPDGGVRPELGGEVLVSGSKVAGGFLWHGVRVAESLSLLHTDFRGPLMMGHEGEHLLWTGRGVVLSGCRLASSAWFQGVQGELTLHNTRAEAEVLVGRAEETPAPLRLSVEGSEVNTLQLDGRTFYKRGVHLSQVRVASLVLSEAVPSLSITDLQYQQLTVPGGDYKAFLAATSPFTADTYQTVEKWLRNRGDDRNADRVYLAMRRRDRAHGMTGWGRLSDALLDWTIGYGIHSSRLIGYLVVMLILTAVLFSSRESVQISEASPWTWADAWFMSLRVNLPMLTLILGSEAKPSGQPLPVLGLLGVTYAGFACVVSLFSYVLVPLFLAGVSGLVKKKD